MRVVSLFSGIGGLDKGFIDAGFTIVWVNDFDKYAVETYNAKILTFLSGRLMSEPIAVYIINIIANNEDRKNRQ